MYNTIWNRQDSHERAGDDAVDLESSREHASNGKSHAGLIALTEGPVGTTRCTLPVIVYDSAALPSSFTISAVGGFAHGRLMRRRKSPPRQPSETNGHGERLSTIGDPDASIPFRSSGLTFMSTSPMRNTRGTWHALGTGVHQVESRHFRTTTGHPCFLESHSSNSRKTPSYLQGLLGTLLLRIKQGEVFRMTHIVPDLP